VQVSVSAPKYDSGGCTDLFRSQGQESGKNSAPLPPPSLVTIYDAMLRSASPVLFVAQGARTWELRIVSTIPPRGGVSGRLSGWARRVRIVGERESKRKSCERRLTLKSPPATSIRIKKKVSG